VFVRAGWLMTALGRGCAHGRILKEYVDLVFYKDLVERYKVANPALLRQLLEQCLSQPASLLSPHKVYNDFRSQGYELSKHTLYRYLHYLEESYIVFLLMVAEPSIRKQAMNPKKLHGVDWALGYPLVPEPFINAGHKLETAIYLHWRRQREDLAYLEQFTWPVAVLVPADSVTRPV
jgi:uncharacterized protein